MPKYETIGGQVTRGETYAKILDLVDQLIDQSAVMAHLHRTESNPVDTTLAHGWLGMSELFRRVRHQVTELAMKRMQ